MSCVDQTAQTDNHVGDLGRDMNRDRVSEIMYAEPASNPNGLAVAVRSPYSGRAESASGWSPPSHGIYWGGDWSGDFWKDNGNAVADYGYSCGEDIYLKVKPKSFQGGLKPQSVKAKFVGYGYACSSGVYSQGGMYQKWQIIAVYDGVETPLGWVVFAHLDSSPVYSLHTVLTVDAPVKIGKIFSGGTTGDCWGSCHIHMELKNYSGKSCYSVGSPWVNINRVGMLVGYNTTTAYCP